jgi:DNA-binding transcriptional ArsR family regulator
LGQYDQGDGDVVTGTACQETEQLYAAICAALADPRRIMLVNALAAGPRCVGDLAAALQLTQPAVSRHLKLLRDQGLVQATRHGANVQYAVGDPLDAQLWNGVME